MVCRRLRRPEKASRVALYPANGMLRAHRIRVSDRQQRPAKKKNLPWQGHKELRTSVGARNDLASSNARNKSLSPSHSARHLEKP